jgi:DNA-binding MarR family transcriptional regulator
MSWKASAYMKELIVCPSGERISRTEKLVAMVLAENYDERRKDYTFSSVKTIAADTLMDERVCRRILAALERKGVIVRQRPERQGRGQLTFYRFPGLEIGMENSTEKGDNMSSFSLPKGGRKEDGRGTKPAPPIEEQKQQKQQKQKAPVVPIAAATGTVESAVAQVRSALSIANPRKLKLVRQVIELEAEKGEPPPTTALAMIAAWREQGERYARDELKFAFGMEKFFGLGIWKDKNAWRWDNDRVRLQAEAGTRAR